MIPSADESVDRRRAVAAARGLAPFDWLISGGTIVDVATGELREADVGLVGAFIASVHPRGARTDAAQIFDAGGHYIAPGFIDAHMHIESSMMVPAAYASVVVPQGTTTVVWDPHEFANVCGLDGVRYAIEASRGLPLRCLVLAPSCVPSAPGLELSGADFGPAEMAEMLGWPDIIGVAEMMDMGGAIEPHSRAAAIVAAGLASGKPVMGHARGLAGADLQAYAAAGVSSDHEITSAADLLEKLRAGLTIELRGSHPYLLPECVAALKSLPSLPSTLTLCTDDVFPDDLVARGGLCELLRILVREGLPAVDAIRAATLNAASRLGRHDLGLVGPGRRADLVLLPDLATFEPKAVFGNGIPVAENGRLTVAIHAPETGALAGTMKLAAPPAKAFQIEMPGMAEASVRLRAIEGARFGRWSEITAEVHDGVAHLPDDASLVAMIHRHGRAPAHVQLAPLLDWGQWHGALATTVSHDSHNLVVFGRDAADMALAAKAVIEAGGGMAVAASGTIKALLALPIAGLVTDAAPADIAAQFAALKEAADGITQWKPPYRVFKAVTGASLACNPGPHLTDLGLTEGATRQILPLLADAS